MEEGKIEKKQDINSSDEEQLHKEEVVVGERYNKDIDIREKRMSFVFKIVYAISFLMVSVFAAILKSREKGINDLFIAESIIASFLFVLLFKMIEYIFEEMQCLKINNRDVSAQRIERTEFCYENIFWFFSAGFVGSVFSWIYIRTLHQYLDMRCLLCTSLICFGIKGFIMDIHRDDEMKKVRKVLIHISDFVLYLGIIAGCLLLVVKE